MYLEEKKRFLEQLNQIRRLNLGPDQNDASGYGLYYVRMPVSITPGECTYQGYGGTTSPCTWSTSSRPTSSPSTFQRLVINDVIDQLGPFLYEAIRSKFYDQDLKPRHEARAKRGGILRALPDLINKHLNSSSSTRRVDAQALRNYIQALTNYILRTGLPLTGDPEQDQTTRRAIVDRLEVLLHSPSHFPLHQYAQKFHALEPLIADVAHGKPIPATLSDCVTHLVGYVAASIMTPTDTVASANLIANFYQSALPDDVSILEKSLGLTDAESKEFSQLTLPLASDNALLNQSLSAASMTKMNVSLASVRTPKQFYPIAPREMLEFFLEENIYLLAKDVSESSRVKQIRSSEVRDYLRHILDPAYFAMAVPADKSSGAQPPLQSEAFMSALRDAISARRFGGKNSALHHLYKDLVEHPVMQPPEYREQADRRALLGDRRRCSAARRGTCRRRANGFHPQRRSLRHA